MQLPIPVQAPFQPKKVESSVGVADRVREVPLGYLSEQFGPQSIPAGSLWMWPLPVIATLMVKKIPPVKVAVTDLLASNITEHVPDPLQTPFQPEKTESDTGKAVRVTVVPLG